MRQPLDHDYFRVPVAPAVYLNVARYGYGGEPIVLLHGFGTSSFLWRRVGPLLALRRASGFAVDLLGHGESDRPFDGDFSISAQASCVEAAMTALHVAQATVVGLNVGAMVALRLAWDNPDRVFRLILVGPPPLDEIAGPEIRELQRDTARYALRLSRDLFGAASLLRPLLQSSVADPASMPPALFGRYVAPYVGSDGASHLLALAGSISEEEMEDVVLERVRQRTLVVRGTRDRWCTRTGAQEYADRIPLGHYEHVDEVGHLVPEEDAETLVRLILAFVRTRDSDEPESERFGSGSRKLGVDA
ncbi:MAG: alpha/beta fold hydrolase [Gemmatimonadota bacterium]